MSDDSDEDIDSYISDGENSIISENKDHPPAIKEVNNNSTRSSKRERTGKAADLKENKIPLSRSNENDRKDNILKLKRVKKDSWRVRNTPEGLFW